MWWIIVVVAVFCTLAVLGACKVSGRISRMEEMKELRDETTCKRGEWLTDEDDVYWGNSVKKKYCSACGKRPHFDRETGKYILTDFCHNCGADMRD